jgi:hypothetical protein
LTDELIASACDMREGTRQHTLPSICRQCDEDDAGTILIPTGMVLSAALLQLHHSQGWLIDDLHGR